MQIVWAGYGDEAREVSLPDSEAEVLDGVQWGRPDVAGTPAYWAVRCLWNTGEVPNFSCRASTLVEEIGFCILGGYSVTFESNIATFEWLKKNAVFDLNSDINLENITNLLREPLNVQGTMRRYRFPNQRARRLNLMRQKMFNYMPEEKSAKKLRDDLMMLEGIGPKTASWIVRNYLDSDEVAIIDVHVVRACCRMGLFPESLSLPRDYVTLEETFLNFARAIKVRSSLLDAVMWTETRAATRR